jgi:hypothetical protein
MTRRLSLTFDNGPTPGITERVLEVLARHGLRVTFFVIGEKLRDKAAAGLLAEIAAAGHWIGNHTLTHSVALGDRNDAAYVRTEIEEAQALVGTWPGQEKLFRPYGKGGLLGPHLFSARALAHLQSHRYTSVIWNMVPGDWMIPDGWDDRCIDDLNRLDDSEQAVKVITRFYRNFHSTRFVKDLFVMRLKYAPSSSAIQSLNQDFGDIITGEKIHAIGATPEERDDGLAIGKRGDVDGRAAGELLLEARAPLPQPADALQRDPRPVAERLERFEVIGRCAGYHKQELVGLPDRLACPVAQGVVGEVCDQFVFVLDLDVPGLRKCGVQSEKVVVSRGLLVLDTQRNHSEEHALFFELPIVQSAVRPFQILRFGIRRSFRALVLRHFVLHR